MIELRNASYAYYENGTLGRRALSDVSLHIARGEFVGLIGHTGSGKSTLVQILAGLLRPTEGQFFFDGRDLSVEKKIMHLLRGKIGLVFQYPEHQLFEETVYRDIAFGPTNLGLPTDEIDRRVRETMRLVHLDESLCEQSPFDLSGGQKRRVAIAGVLAMRPQVLILDEPTAGLDPAGRDEILAELRQIHGDWCETVILVSHSMEDVAKTVGRVIVMNGGVVAMDGTVAEVFSRGEELHDMGLNTPQIARVAEKLRARGIRLPNDLYTVDAVCEAILQLLGGEGRA